MDNDPFKTLIDGLKAKADRERVTRSDVETKVPFELANQLYELDRTIVGFAKLMVPTIPLEPDQRIQAAENLVELQKARKQLVSEILELIKTPVNKGKLH
jgi:hypothetical protein